MVVLQLKSQMTQCPFVNYQVTEVFTYIAFCSCGQKGYILKIWRNIPDNVATNGPWPAPKINVLNTYIFLFFPFNYLALRSYNLFHHHQLRQERNLYTCLLSLKACQSTRNITNITWQTLKLLTVRLNYFLLCKTTKLHF